MNKIELLHGDCLELMDQIPDKSIDMILCDPPYGVTPCEWDSIIPFDKLWEQYSRIIKDRSVIVLFGREPFSSYLRLSNIEWYKYDWIWSKTKVSGFHNSKVRPLSDYETISVFSTGTCASGSERLMKYYPQELQRINKKVSGTRNVSFDKERHKFARPSDKESYTQEFTNYPRQILTFNNESKAAHPTQKPVPLLEYLIKTYTLENETVLDNTMGSGSTGVACVNTGRNFIGIEKELKYFEIAQNEIKEAKEKKSLELF